ncbi:MAG: hypothetical protein IJW18_02215 [Lachnospiraceae bacterium]|nr:hypothetical protein [Lachnospiraceae bacterium]
MIYVIKREDKLSDKENAEMVTAVLAVNLSLKYSLRTLAIQFVRESSVEKLLGIRTDDKKSLHTEGIDGLIRYQSYSMLTGEHFDMCTVSALKSNRLLDVMRPSEAEDILRDMAGKVDELKEIIRVAGEAYDNVIILVDSGEQGLATFDECIESFKYIQIIPVMQGKVPGITRDERVVYLIHDYNYDSYFSTKYYRKCLNTRRVYVLPYNISFKDSCQKGELIKFFAKNLRVDCENYRRAKKEDANAEFIFETEAFIRKILTENDLKDSDVVREDNLWEDRNFKEIIRKKNVKCHLNGENIVVKETGVLRKQIKTTLGTSEDSMNSNLNRTNFLYRTKQQNFDKLAKIAASHNRSISSEMDYVLKNYFSYYDSAKSLTERETRKSGSKNEYLIEGK